MPKKSKKRNTRNRKRNTITRKRSTKKNYKRKSLRIKRKRQKGGGPDEGVWNSFLYAVKMIPTYADGPDDPENGHTNKCISLLDENNELPFFKIQAYNKTPLHYAIESGSKNLIYKVIETMNTFLKNKVQEHVYDQERADDRRKLYMNMICPNGSPLKTLIMKMIRMKMIRMKNTYLISIIDALIENGAIVNQHNELFNHSQQTQTPQALLFFYYLPRDLSHISSKLFDKLNESDKYYMRRLRPYFLRLDFHEEAQAEAAEEAAEEAEARAAAEEPDKEVPTTGVLTGIDDEYEDKNEKTNFYLSIRNGNYEEMKTIFEKRKIRLGKDEDEGSDLVHEIYGGKKTCINIAVDPRMIQSKIGGMSSVIVNFNILKLLLENGADVNVRDSHGDTPLSKLISNYDIYTNSKEDIYKIIKLLRKHGADVNQLFEENHHLFLPPTPQGIIAKLLEPLPDAINLNEEKIIILKRLHLHNKTSVDIHSTNIDDEAY